MNIVLGSAILTVRRNGSFKSLVDSATGLNIQPGLEAGWPFAALVRNRATGYFDWILLNADYRGPCKARREKRGATAWSLHYPNLRYRNGEATSLSVTLKVGTVKGAFTIEPTLDAGAGTHELAEFILFSGNVLDLDVPEHERVAIPEWGEGKIFHNPRQVSPVNMWVGPYFMDGAHHLSYTAEFGMDMAYGWMAAHGRRAGLALGFINARMLTMEFKFSRSEAGLGLGAVFFRLRTYAESFPFCQEKPLSLGRFLLIPLEGDWHRAADIYRAEYRRVFTDCVPPLGQGSERTASLDVNLHYGILGAHAQTAQSAFNLTFADVVTRARDFIRRYKIRPRRVMVWLYGIGVYGHDRCNPTQRPILGAAGGHRGFVKMGRDLQKLGIGAHVEYTHPWATQQNQPGYDPDMDTGKSHKMMGVVLHNALCLDYRKTLEFYRDKVFKPFKQDGVTDLFLDQATLCQGICQRAHHDHGTDAEGVLGAHARGTFRQLEILREVMGPRTFVSTESHNDLGCRTIEMSVNGDPFAEKWAMGTVGVESAPQVVQYTFPHVVRMVNHGAAASLPMICVCGRNSMLSQLVGQDEAVKAYLQFKDRMARTGLGYPFGFRDDVGLTVGGSNLVAKIYVDPKKGLTLTYFARQAVETEVTVDLAAHGWEGTWRVPLSLKAGEFGFVTRRMKKASSLG